VKHISISSALSVSVNCWPSGVGSGISAFIVSISPAFHLSALISIFPTQPYPVPLACGDSYCESLAMDASLPSILRFSPSSTQFSRSSPMVSRRCTFWRLSGKSFDDIPEVQGGDDLLLVPNLRSQLMNLLNQVRCVENLLARDMFLE
jgi:hypothetical protein